MVGGDLVLAEDDDLRDGFAIVMGAPGSASPPGSRFRIPREFCDDFDDEPPSGGVPKRSWDKTSFGFS